MLENLSENTENVLCSQKLASAIFKSSSPGPQAYKVDEDWGVVIASYELLHDG